MSNDFERVERKGQDLPEGFLHSRLGKNAYGNKLDRRIKHFIESTLLRHKGAEPSTAQIRTVKGRPDIVVRIHKLRETLDEESLRQAQVGYSKLGTLINNLEEHGIPVPVLKKGDGSGEYNIKFDQSHEVVTITVEKVFNLDGHSKSLFDWIQEGKTLPQELIPELDNFLVNLMEANHAAYLEGTPIYGDIHTGQIVHGHTMQEDATNNRFQIVDVGLDSILHKSPGVEYLWNSLLGVWTTIIQCEKNLMGGVRLEMARAKCREIQEEIIPILRGMGHHSVQILRG